jgi:phosphoglycerate kinase
LHKFIEKADTIIIGGAMAYTFLKAKGVNIGASIVDKDSIEVAREIMQYAQDAGKKLLLPIDHIALSRSDKNRVIHTTKKLGGDLVGYDIGPATISLFKKEIATAKQIFWNGPMGMFENSYFASGTHEIAIAIASSKAYSIVGGGDTVSAVNKYKLAEKMSFISTGGGATMEFMEKGSLPCIDVIQEKAL